MKILTLSDFYLPGYKGGGIMRTLCNMVDRLSEDFRFKVITRDRDMGDSKPYPSISDDAWHRIGEAEVFYLPPRKRTLRELRRLIRATPHDALYLNGCFSRTFTIRPLILRRLGLIPRSPLVLAPRGEFSPGAMRIKGLRKRVYLSVTKALGLYQDVVWQASSEYEEADVRCWIGAGASVTVLPEMPPPVDPVEEPPPRSQKLPGRLEVLFLSRVSRKKNLDGALRMFEGMEGEISFNIYGPLEDEEYWSDCQEIARRLPKNVRVSYRGVVEYERVGEVMRAHDLFFMPTFGENFGHVILEALLAGSPVLISDQTPWRGLREKGVGWDLPLNNTEPFRAVLRRCVAMDAEEHGAWVRRAYAYGLGQARDQTVVEQYRKFFDGICYGSSGRERVADD